jgi:hypothetical protein
VCGLTLRRKTNRQACFISPSAERPIVRRFDTRGKTRLASGRRRRNGAKRQAFSLPGENFVPLVDVARANFKVNAFLHGSARWADLSDIKAAGLLNNDGVYVGAWRDKGGKIHYLRHAGPEHVPVLRPTRSGKGVGLKYRVVMRSIVGLDCTIQNVEPQQLERKWVKGSPNVCATRGDYRKWRSSGGTESPDSINWVVRRKGK